MIKVFADLTINTTLPGPGVYRLMASGLTITLPFWGAWPEKGTITIKDGTGSNPTATIQVYGGGTIDGTSSITLTVGNESLTFQPYMNGNDWLLQ